MRNKTVARNGPADLFSLRLCLSPRAKASGGRHEIVRIPDLASTVLVPLRPSVPLVSANTVRLPDTVAVKMTSSVFYPFSKKQRRGSTGKPFHRQTSKRVEPHRYAILFKVVLAVRFAFFGTRLSCGKPLEPLTVLGAAPAKP